MAVSTNSAAPMLDNKSRSNSTVSASAKDGGKSKTGFFSTLFPPRRPSMFSSNSVNGNNNAQSSAAGVLFGGRNSVESRASEGSMRPSSTMFRADELFEGMLLLHFEVMVVCLTYFLL